MRKFTRLIQVGLVLSLTTVTVNSFAAMNNSVNNVVSDMQNVSIKGIVIDNTGLPVIGATAIIQGTSSGSSTDVNGQFSFDAPVGSVINVAFIGYTTTSFTVVANQSSYNVTLEEDALLADEVIVTALGIKRSTKALGYSATELKGDEIANINVTSPVTALQGKVAGVSISQTSGGVMGGTKIQIRGMSTLGDDNQPIFVVDGLIFENPSSGNNSVYDERSQDFGNVLKNLNSEDFETMSILKGAAATALYGSRGINGAVVITTKSGKSGDNFGVSFTQVTGVETVYRTPDFQNEFGVGAPVGSSFINFPNQPDGSTNIWESSPRYEQMNGEWVPTLRNSNTAAGFAFGPKMSDMTDLWGGNIIDYDGETVKNETYPNNMKDAYNMGFNTKTSIAISGGTEKATFYLSNTYQNRTGTYESNNFELFSTLIKGSYKVSDRIKVDASMNLSSSTGQNPPRNTGRGFWWGDTNRQYNTNKFRDKWETDHGGKPSTDYGDKYGAVPGMGLWWDAANNLYEQRTTLITPIIRLSYEITDWASFLAEGNMNLQYDKNETKEMGSGYQREGGYYSIGLSENIQRSAKASFNFNKRFGDFGASVIVGGEWWRTRGVNTNLYTAGGLIVPGQFFIGNSKNPVIGAGSDITRKKNIYSTYFLAAFDYKEQFFLDITGRNDWTTALVYSDARDSQSSYFYPSVSGSWLFSETFEMPTWVDFGKLRGSWAQVGRDTDPYSINTAYSVGSGRYPGGTVYTADFDNRLVNPGLRGELKTSIEFGVDLRFLKNRLGLDVTYYKENTRNQIQEIPTPFESGVDGQMINTGDVQNKGWEIALKTTPIRTNNFEWDLDFIYTRNRNKIISMHESLGDYISLKDSDYSQGGMHVVAYVGGFYGEILTVNNAKVDEQGRKILRWNEPQRAAYYEPDGIETSIGKLAPDFEGSISTSLRFHGVSISALIDGRFGGYMASFSSKYATGKGRTESSLEYRTPEYGGMEFTSQHADSKGIKYEDGMIPDGVLHGNANAEGKHELIVQTPGGGLQDVHGMTFQDAYDAGYVEPVHAGMWHRYNNGWKSAVVDDSWSNDDVRFIALRQLSVGYTFPAKITDKLRLSNLHVSLDGHNLCYLYNNMPNGINPEGVDGSSAGAYLEQSFSPYTATYSLSIRFNL